MKATAQILAEPSVHLKLKALDEALHGLLNGHSMAVPNTPGRDLEIVPIRALPAKKGLSQKEGQARLLHDLASIELQAMELGLRTLAEFPNAPRAFREELAEITADEGEHLGLCLKAMEDLGLPWGTYPAHLGLWESVAPTDSLLDRIAIVHRYLEGSGLDASDTILRRLSGVKGNAAMNAVRTIRRDEMGHVQFGSRWYHDLAKAEGLEPSHDFAERLKRLFHRVPRRLEPVVTETRLQAGFTLTEIEALNDLRARWLDGAGASCIHPEKPIGI